MPSEIDFDESNSSLQIGIEVEYPVAESYDELLIKRGNSSNHINSEISSWPSTIGGRAVYDGTVGLEVVSNVLYLEDAEGWYRDVIEYVENEYGAPYQPTGLMNGGSTAGTHIHISQISEQKARDLASISQEPWAQVMFCSSIAADEDGGVSWPVFRGGRYCQMQFGTGHYDVINARGNGHFEWRLVEPMVPEHLQILVKFLRIFEQDTDAAIQYAQERLDNVDNRITSLKRAEAIGMDMESMPIVVRGRSENDPENFYETVESEWFYPEIYCVTYEGQDYYTFNTRLDGQFEAEGVEFNSDDVLHADSLNSVTNDQLEENIRRALNRRGSTDRETAATEELKKVLKKK